MSRRGCVHVYMSVCVLAHARASERHSIPVWKNNVPSQRDSKWMSPRSPEGLVKIAQRLIRSEAARRF